MIAVLMVVSIVILINVVILKLIAAVPVILYSKGIELN